MSSLKQLFVEEDLVSCASDHQELRMAPHKCCPNLIWREKVAQWCYDVVDHLGESRGTVYIAMNVLDRYSALNFSARTSEREYEAAALTALFMAIRIAGKVSLAAVDLLRMSRQGVKVQEIVKVGKAMTEQLSWDHRVVTPIEFVHAFVGGTVIDSAFESLQDDQRRRILATATFLCEVAACDSFFTSVSASRVAIAALTESISSQTSIPHEQKHTILHNVTRRSGLHPHTPEISALNTRLHQLCNQEEQCRTDSLNSPHLIPEEDEDDAKMDDHYIPETPHRVVSRERLLPHIVSDYHPQPILPTTGEPQRAVSPTSML
uniref:Cyclin N-terminal domain-containing protein n=1 Tax=Grammatophora oceanica TaxID=210454 RepID=A0A7S1VTL2_9STRA|mmetsp:Transcript_6943/g.10112  ORF Transcript_6943/g.10112 Transcript_6943/m.10112 type:complete len:320 (+) Transcript_6943:165-1124(+)|eukprot:CAMPEP_0194037022 /NCGR_PEP_ID=MMETSP0009_2-20130614/9382_1 /TAXON_ID=210454 /ORGANISM="Grammatophora oceanica, Strain CCMP 410" /LENGTH=319 /DNA_ID=CAMNT_0038679013 /DNA_START=160 /DNA_END=1119 /DNA_ORIENTATION=-